MWLPKTPKLPGANLRNDVCGRAVDAARAVRDGGGFGSIVGRNSFQRKKEDALKFLGTAMGIYEGSIK